MGDSDETLMGDSDMEGGRITTMHRSRSFASVWWRVPALLVAAYGACAHEAPVSPEPAKEHAVRVTLEYAVTDEQPAMDDARWKAIPSTTDGYAITDVPLQRRYWVRAAHADTAAPTWVAYGPLGGDNRELDVVAEQDVDGPGVLQFWTAKGSEKGFKCCRVKVRIRATTKRPRVTVNELVPVTLRWRRALPEVTVRGPNIRIEDLPRLPRLDNPLPSTGPRPIVGMQCEIVDGDSQIRLQNGEPAGVDVWISWKRIVTGPIRIEPKTMRSLPRTAYASCETALSNIYIVKVEWSR